MILNLILGVICKIHVRSFELFSCDQAALWMVQSVRLSVCLSVRLSVCLSVCPSVCLSHLFHYVPSAYHHEIMKFSGVITNERSDVHAKGQSQRAKVKVTEVKIQLSRFRAVTPVWIDIWWWNDAQSLVLLRRGALFFCKIIRQISRYRTKKPSILTQIGCFRTVTPVWIHQWLKIRCTKLEVA